jgi:hypothetical protein
MPFDAVVNALTEALARALGNADHGVLSLPALGLITDQTPHPGRAKTLAVWLVDLPTTFPTGLNQQTDAIAGVAHTLSQPAGRTRLGVDQMGPEPPLACVLLRDGPVPDPDRPTVREALAVDVDNQCYLCQHVSATDRILALITPSTDPYAVPGLGALYGALSAVLQACQP